MECKGPRGEIDEPFPIHFVCALIWLIAVGLLLSGCATAAPHGGWKHGPECDMSGSVSIHKNWAEICRFDGSYFREQDI